MYSADGYEVLDVHGNLVTEWAVPVAPTNTDSAFGGQVIGIEDSEDKLMEDADKHLGEGVTGGKSTYPSLGSTIRIYNV